MLEMSRVLTYIGSLAIVGLASSSALGQTQTIAGIEFTVKSATIYGSSPEIRFILGAKNNTKNAIGFFMIKRETLMAIDTGYTYQGSSIIQSSGALFCSDDRNLCLSNKNSFLTTIPPGLNNNIIILFQGPSTNDGIRSIRSGTLSDFTGTIYLQINGGDSGFVALSLPDIRVKIP